MKETLKALAEKLPEKYQAYTYDNEFVIAYQSNPSMYAIIEYNESDIQNSRGILTLLQFIESQGYNYQLSSFVNESPNVYRVTWCKTLKEARDGEQVAFGATIAEAVAKAALEVAGRME